MAAYTRNNVFWSSLMFLLFISSSHAITGADINAICSKTRNPSFCLSFLKSNPKTSSANLQTLARITVESVQASASETLKQIQSLVQTATDPESKRTYTSCSENYNDAIDNLDEAKQFLAAGDAASTNIRVSAALDGADTCLEDLKNVKVDASIVKKSEDLENACGVILVISNMLPRRA